jgi:hypothetical protein
MASHLDANLEGDWPASAERGKPVQGSCRARYGQKAAFSRGI